MNRFLKTRPLPALLARAVPLLFFLAVLAAFLLGLDTVTGMTERQEAEGLASSVRRSAVHCYALEGFYPDDLAYLEAHYGLRYDKSKYVVSYETVGSNLMPDVTVIRLRQ